MNKKFTDYLLYAMTMEYENFDEKCLEVLEKAAFILEGLLSHSFDATMRILCEYNIASVLGDLLKIYFLSSDSPLKILEVLEQGDFVQLGKCMSLLTNFMNCANQFICFQAQYVHGA